MPLGGLDTDIQNFANEWGTLFTLLLSAAIVYVLVRMLRMMPKTKPVQIKPDVEHEIGWDDIAGVDEAKAELRRGRRVPERPDAL